MVFHSLVSCNNMENTVWFLVHMINSTLALQMGHFLHPSDLFHISGKGPKESVCKEEAKR